MEKQGNSLEEARIKSGGWKSNGKKALLVLGRECEREASQELDAVSGVVGETKIAELLVWGLRTLLIYPVRFPLTKHLTAFITWHLYLISISKISLS